MSTIAAEYENWAKRVADSSPSAKLTFYCGAAAALFSLRDAGVVHGHLTQLLAEVDLYFESEREAFNVTA